MGQAKLRKQEIEALKALKQRTKNSDNLVAIEFKCDIFDDDNYSLFASFTQKVVNDVKLSSYDIDKCMDIILENSGNLIAVKNGAEVNATTQPAIQRSLRNVSLAVLKLVLLDPYKQMGLQPDSISMITLNEDDEGNIGLNLIGDNQSMMKIRRGIKNRLDEILATREVDFITDSN
jgi:hypothetical protein